MFSVGGDNELSFAPVLYFKLLHGASYSLIAHPDESCNELFLNLGPAVQGPDFGMDGPNWAKRAS